MKNSFLVFLLLFISTVVSYAQTSEAKAGDAITIVTNDGSKISGVVDKVNSTSIWINSPAFGVIELKREEIEKIDIVGGKAGLDKKGYLIDYHGSTHYLIGQSAFGLKKGQAYYENVYVFFNSLSYGVTDNFSITVGGEISSLLFDSRFPTLFISPKFSFANDNYGGLSIGATILTVPSNDFSSAGILQANYTIGSRSHNFTLGTGYGFTFDNGFEDDVIPIIGSFMTRLSRRLSLVSENYVFLSDGEAYGIFSMALRIHFSKPGTSLTTGLWRTSEEQDGFLALPYVGATISF
jgi:hypothetical protein